MRQTQVVLSILLCFIAVNTFAQNRTLKGSVLLDNNTPASNAILTVTSKQYQNTLYQSMCDSLGQFSLAIDDIDLQDALINSGYMGYFTSSVACPTDMSPIKIVLKANPLKVDEVTVTGSKPLITYDMTEMNVDVKQIKNYERMSTSEVLARIPGVMGSGSSWKLYGQDLTIYVNGKKQTIPAHALTAFLESLPSKSLKNIKLNTLSYGRYGDSGGAIMDIIIDKDMADSKYIAATVHSSLAQGDYSAGGGNLFYMVKKGSTLFNTTLAYNNNDLWDNRVYSTYFGDRDMYYKTNNQSDGQKNGVSSSSNLTLFLKNDNILDINLFAYYDGLNSTRDWSDTISSDNFTNTELYKYNNGSNNSMYSTSIRFSTSEKRKTYLDISYGGMYGERANDKDFYTVIDDKKYQTQNYQLRGQMHNLSTKVVTKLSDKFTIDYGVNLDFNLANTTNNYIYTGSNPESLQQNKALEFLSNTYLIAHYNINKRMGLIARARHQYTYQSTKDTYSGSRVGNKYGKLTPSINFWMTKKDYKLVIDAMSYLEYPGYADMYNGRTYINEYIYGLGNPSLIAEKNNFVSLDQTFWGAINLYLMYKNIKDVTDYIYHEDENGNIYYKRANVADWNYVTIRLSLPISLFGNVVYGDIDGRTRYGKFFNYNSEYLPQKDSDWDIQDSAIVYNLFADITDKFTISSDGKYIFGYYALQNYYEPVYNMRVGASYSFAKDRFMAKFDVTPIINEDVTINKNFDNNEMLTNYRNRVPRLSFSLRYQFSQGSKVEKREFMKGSDRF